ncbi:hypothetical protein B2G71_00785 [Novosphingobium sp. PC22D]|nr:hypothetical protein B2G71_00785 [Novosphingobium sp. PC22D]
MPRLSPFAALLLLSLPACAGSTPPRREPAPAASPAYPGEATRVLSERDAARLRNNKGLTLQWIDWNTRGSAVVTPGPLWTLRGAQAQAGGKGRLFLDGVILEIGEGYFTFRGTIRISDTPDPGRKCEADKTWHFAVTQNRSYYRLREFEWCDYLTDYVDLYF